MTLAVTVKKKTQPPARLFSDYINIMTFTPVSPNFHHIKSEIKRRHR